jgi:isopentenyldiphosphate isomerase
MPLDNPEELFYWVDEQDHELGSMTRAEAHSGSNKIHRSIHILFFDELDQILLQKRSKFKDKHSNLWGPSVGGHVTYGEGYKQTAKREAQEELGIEVDELEFINHFLLELPDEKEFAVNYKANLNFTPDNLDPDEVGEVAWKSSQAVEEMATDGLLTPAAVIILKSISVWDLDEKI